MKLIVLYKVAPARHIIMTAGAFCTRGILMSANKRGNVWLGASGLVRNNAGEWLVVKKNYSALKGIWSFPAGFVDGGETADQAAIREVKEETGIDCRLEGLIGFRTGVLQTGVSDNMAIFLLSPIDKNQMLIPELKEITEVAWKSPLELKEDGNASIMILEIAEKVLATGFNEIININPGDRFGYTSYKIFFEK